MTDIIKVNCWWYRQPVGIYSNKGSGYAGLTSHEKELGVWKRCCQEQWCNYFLKAIYLKIKLNFT